MRTHSLLSALATAASLAVVASPAAAQLSVAARPLAAGPASPVVSVGHRVLAEYNFRNGPIDVAFPRTVTVADSAGTLVAHANFAGQRAEVPMTVTIIDSDLVLQGQTADGVLTLVLDRQNEGLSSFENGRWTLGSVTGSLRGKTKP